MASPHAERDIGKAWQAVAAGLTPAAQRWRADGRGEIFRGQPIHVFEREGAGPPLVMLHGFPSSSFDWRALLDRERDRAVLAPDFLGFGLSAKPRDHVYSLFWQADLIEELVRRRSPEGPVFIVAHDMGTSVATELLARDLEGELSFAIAGALLFNGSIVLDRASLTSSQRMLRGPLGGLFARLSNERFFRRQLGAVFSEAHPLTAAEAADQWSLFRHNGGRTLGHRLIHYLGERERHAERWHGAVRDWPGPLTFAWGTEDPVATLAVLDALRELRPAAPVERLEGIGHYPQIEAPDSIAAALSRAAPPTRSP
jgi:pimeloyl-ACP methyl ester carboxylesterase